MICVPSRGHSAGGDTFDAISGPRNQRYDGRTRTIRGYAIEDAWPRTTARSYDELAADDTSERRR